MLLHMIAGIIASAIAYVPHLLLEDHVSSMTAFLVTSVVGGVAYVFSFYKLKQLRGEI